MNPSQVIPRTQWAAALLRMPAEPLIDLAEKLSQRYRTEFVRVPQAGLALMPFRDSVMGQPFYLGELPMSAAHVKLTDDAGQVYEGGAHVMADDSALAAAIAVCDAVLAADLDGAEEVMAMVQAGQRLSEQEAVIRAEMLTRTRVSFSLMTQDTDEPLASGEQDRGEA